MNAQHVRRYVDNPPGRAMAVVEWIEHTVGGSGYTYADVHAFLAGPGAEPRWRALTMRMPHFTLDDRQRVLDTLRRRAELWGQEIRHVDIDQHTRSKSDQPADPFAGIPHE